MDDAFRSIARPVAGAAVSGSNRCRQTLHHTIRCTWAALRQRGRPIARAAPHASRGLPRGAAAPLTAVACSMRRLDPGAPDRHTGCLAKLLLIRGVASASAAYAPVQ